MRTEKELARKYAFNINNKEKTQKIKGSGNDFENLNKGFYDEIEKTESKLKTNKNNLSNKKLNVIREMVYTNKSIPDVWKSKLDFHNQIMKLIIKDKKFLSYLGRGREIEKNFIENDHKFLKKNFSQKNIKSKKELYKNLLYKRKPEIINEESDISNKNLFKNKHKKSEFGEKDIKEILEEFKINYKLKENQELEINNSNEKSLMRNFIERKYNSETPNKIVNPFSDIYKLKPEKRKELYRQGIFTNLIPSKTSLTTREKKPLIFQNKLNEDDYSINVSSKNFYKKIKINDPVKFKYLKLIKFHGPYYSFCPPCNNRNIEFYNQLERNQCIKLLNYIRKERSNLLENQNNHSAL